MTMLVMMMMVITLWWRDHWRRFNIIVLSFDPTWLLHQKSSTYVCYITVVWCCSIVLLHTHLSTSMYNLYYWRLHLIYYGWLHMLPHVLLHERWNKPYTRYTMVSHVTTYNVAWAVTTSWTTLLLGLRSLFYQLSSKNLSLIIFLGQPLFSPECYVQT
jgi:hypothetical protein